MTSQPDVQTILYTTQFALALAFAAACFFRAWQNGLHHKGIRWSLLWFGGLLVSFAVVRVYGVYGRSIPDLAVRNNVYSDRGYLIWNVLIDVTMVCLFFALQKPRESDKGEPGATGHAGAQGVTGAQGEQGVQGVQGQQGEQGTSL